MVRCGCDGHDAYHSTAPQANACPIRCAQPYHRSSDDPDPPHHSHSHRPRPGAIHRIRDGRHQEGYFLDICASSIAASKQPIQSRKNEQLGEAPGQTQAGPASSTSSTSTSGIEWGRPQQEGAASCGGGEGGGEAAAAAAPPPQSRRRGDGRQEAAALGPVRGGAEVGRSWSITEYDCVVRETDCPSRIHPIDRSRIDRSIY